MQNSNSKGYAHVAGRREQESRKDRLWEVRIFLSFKCGSRFHYLRECESHKKARDKPCRHTWGERRGYSRAERTAIDIYFRQNIWMCGRRKGIEPYLARAEWMSPAVTEK